MCGITSPLLSRKKRTTRGKGRRVDLHRAQEDSQAKGGEKSGEKQEVGRLSKKKIKKFLGV